MLVPEFDDQSKFNAFVLEAYNMVAHEHGASIEVDLSRNVALAYERFLEIQKAFAASLPNPSTGPDNFKDAAALCFALRRARPIAYVRPTDALRSAIADGDSAAVAQILSGEPVVHPLGRLSIFISFADEICAFQAGLRVVHYFEAQKKANMLKRSGEISTSQWDGIFFQTKPVLSDSFNMDAMKTLRDHSLSPHSLYLLYRACFDRAAKTNETEK